MRLQKIVIEKLNVRHQQQQQQKFMKFMKFASGAIQATGANGTTEEEKVLDEELLQS